MRHQIEQMFIDCASWNENSIARKNGSDRVDPDPDGSMRRLADGLDRMLAEDPGVGPIPPIGGWSAPIELAALGKALSRLQIH